MPKRRKAQYHEVSFLVLLGALAWAVGLASEEWHLKQWKVEPALLPGQKFDVLLTAGLYSFELDAAKLVAGLRPHQHQGVSGGPKSLSGVSLDEEVESLVGGGGDLEDLVVAPRLEVGQTLTPAGTKLLDALNDLQGADRTYAAFSDLCPKAVQALRDVLLERPTGPGAANVDLGPAMTLAFAAQDAGYLFCEGVKSGQTTLSCFSTLSVFLLVAALVSARDLAKARPNAWTTCVGALGVTTACMAGVCFSFTHGLRMSGLNNVVKHALSAQKGVAESFSGQVAKHGDIIANPGAAVKLVWDGAGQSFYWAVCGVFFLAMALTRVATGGAPKRKDKSDGDLEDLVNDEGCPVALSYNTGERPLYYCGRMVGADVIGHPLSDGHCGPVDGPQCPSCVRFQRRADGR